MEKFIPQFQPLVKKKWALAVFNQIMSGWIGPGKAVEELENKIKEISGAQYAVSTTSGTTALMLAIHSLKIPLSKKILFPSYTFLAGANAARFMGYEVGMVDINPNTLCMDIDHLTQIFEESRYYNGASKESDIGAVMFVNHNGYVGEDVVKAKYICDCNYVPMIEDSSQALGIPNAGMTGDVGVFSFSVPKIISTGQGGVVITNNPNCARRACELRDHGDNWRTTKIHENLGVNFKFDDIHAAYGLAQLKELDWLMAQRKRIYDEYTKHLGNVIYKCEDQPSPWMIILITPTPRGIAEKLKRENIQAVQYYKPLHDNPPYADLKYTDKTAAEWAYDNTLYLPSSLSLTNEEIKIICDIIKS